MRFFLIGLFSLFILWISMSCESKKETKEEPSVLKNEVEQPKAITIPDDADSTESGLKYVDLVEGDGDAPKAGQKVVAHYTGLLMNGKKFDSSYDRNAPIEFTVGVGEMIAGFDEGVLTMKKGGKRKLFIPSELAYGSNGNGVIPPNAMIVFEVELVDIK